MDLNEAMRTTFAARQYTGEPLPDAVLYNILDNARFAPSGGNRQGNRVIIVRDQIVRDRIADLMAPMVKRYMAQTKAGEAPFNTIVSTRLSAADIDATPVSAAMTTALRTASVLLVFTVDLKVVASMDQYLDRVGIVSGASIYPFVWNVLLGARQAGFGGALTTLAIAAEPAIKELLGIPADFAVCALVPLGKPVKQLTRLRRRPVEELAVVESFDGQSFRR
ncbi:MAG: nitroreductase family protein [Proteobacteria bacterium]|nr:nitroreductase family protein [Pseudomonadota bacterium]